MKEFRFIFCAVASFMCLSQSSVQGAAAAEEEETLYTTIDMAIAERAFPDTLPLIAPNGTPITTLVMQVHNTTLNTYCLYMHHRGQQEFIRFSPRLGQSPPYAIEAIRNLHDLANGRPLIFRRDQQQRNGPNHRRAAAHLNPLSQPEPRMNTINPEEPEE